jgi:hypothetical protein
LRATPTVDEDVKRLPGGLQRSRVLRALIQLSSDTMEHSP